MAFGSVSGSQSGDDSRSGPGSRRLSRSGSRWTGPDGGSEDGEAPSIGADPEPVADPNAVADPDAVARAIVLRRLTMAPRTRAQLADDLHRREVPDEVAQRVLDRFGEVGLVDDQAFAHAWVRSRHEGRGLARRALAHELRQRGVDDETAARAVDEVDDADEADAAAALVARRLPSTRRLARDVRIRRLAGLLARKGYAGDLAMRVVRDALTAESALEEATESLPADRPP